MKSKKYYRIAFREAISEYREHHRECAVCLIDDRLTQSRRFPPGLQMAHIFGGPNRKDHPANVLMLCSRCHLIQHNGCGKFNSVRVDAIDTGVLLSAKERMGELDLNALSEITGYGKQWIFDLVSQVPESYKSN